MRGHISLLEAGHGSKSICDTSTSSIPPRARPSRTERLPTEVTTVVGHGGLEAGGAKWVCAIGQGSAELLETETHPNNNPGGNDLFRWAVPQAEGPIDVRRPSPPWGQITTTPNLAERIPTLSGRSP